MGKFIDVYSLLSIFKVAVKFPPFKKPSKQRCDWVFQTNDFKRRMLDVPKVFVAK